MYIKFHSGLPLSDRSGLSSAKKNSAQPQQLLHFPKASLRLTCSPSLRCGHPSRWNFLPVLVMKNRFRQLQASNACQVSHNLLVASKLTSDTVIVVTKRRCIGILLPSLQLEQVHVREVLDDALLHALAHA